MKMNITDAAQKKLAGYLTNGSKLVLDLDDGVGPYSNVGTCALGTSFRLLVVDADAELKDFSTSLTSPLGEVYIKPYSAEYFTEANTLDMNTKYQTLFVNTDSGILDNNVEILDKRSVSTK